MKFKFTARATPQQNSLAKKGIGVCYHRECAMMDTANIPEHLNKYSLFREVFQHATKLDNLAIVKINEIDQTRYKNGGYEIPKKTENMKTWGKVGVKH